MTTACSSPAPQKPETDAAVMIAAQTWPAAVGEVTLQRQTGDGSAALLDVGVAVFDPGIPSDPAVHGKQGIFPAIRKAEARYIPVVLRHLLIEADAWGVVRVLPEPDPKAELLVSGEIVHSDGVQLVLKIKAVDASGFVWLDQLYRDLAQDADYPVAPDGDPYIDLYRKIANDLLAVQRHLASGQRGQIAQLSLLRYAADLAPDAFASYLNETPEGGFQLARLPAADDPMLGRVQKIRNQEYLFIDTVDEQYAGLYEEMAPTYHLWRQYGREQAVYKEDYQRRLAERDSQGRRGSFIAMQQTYNAFKWSKIQVQDLEELALGFRNEVAPTAMEVNGRVFRLSGSLTTQYSQWREILHSIFALENGLPADSG